MNKKLNKTGFTLIEVVLTIAIGALIFLLAFVAFRNAQVNRRDSQRRSDLDKIAAEVNNYASDHSGSVPKNSDFLSTYANGLKDPGPKEEAYVTIKSGAGFVVYTPGAAKAVGCDDKTLIEGTKDYKVTMQLEKGIACRDSASVN